MLSRIEAWFSIFIAAYQAIISTAQHTAHSAAELAKAHADEAMLHLHPGVIREPRPEPIDNPLPEGDAGDKIHEGGVTLVDRPADAPIGVPDPW